MGTKSEKECVLLLSMVAMITDVIKDKWNTIKDPLSKLAKENMIRIYAKCNVSKKFAQSIAYKLSLEVFAESLKLR